MPSMTWIRNTEIADENDLFLISDQMCPADVTRLQQPLDLEVIFSAINAVYIAL